MLSTLEAAACVRSRLSPASAHNDNAEWLAKMPARSTSVHRVAPESTLFGQGDSARYLYQVTKGVLRLCRLMTDGRRSVTGFAYAGDMIGIAAWNSYAYSAETVTACQLRRTPRPAIDKLLKDLPRLAQQMYAMVSNELLAAQDQMLLLGRKTADERVASFLLKLAERKQSGKIDWVDLPMSRTDIADYLGLTTETVSRVLTKLKQAGIISLPTPHLVKLLTRRGCGASPRRMMPRRPRRSTGR